MRFFSEWRNLFSVGIWRFFEKSPRSLCVCTRSILNLVAVCGRGRKRSANLQLHSAAASGGVSDILCIYILFKRRSSRPAKGSRSLKCTFKWITTWLSVQRKPSKTHTPSRRPVYVSLSSLFHPACMPEEN